MEREQVDILAKKIWEYHHLNHTLKKADIIIGFTSFDLSVAEYAAELYKKGYASKVLFAGDNAQHHLLANDKNVMRTNWGMSEAEKFAETAIQAGVPPESILVESRSTNSELNVRMSYELLNKVNNIPKTIILVQKPTMERRAYATFVNFWPEKDYELMVSSPQYSYEEYVGTIADREQIINVMVGDLQRIKVYPAKGFQIYQEIPEDVWQAYEALVALGYDKHVVIE
jgi:uncharacterized SAM-binding protein YcdF (DUF218 family)